MVFSYTSKLFEFNMSMTDASAFIDQNKNNPELNERMIKGFDNFITCLELYFQIMNIDSSESFQIRIFGTVTLQNGAILRATNKFHNWPWFSNIAVHMDDEELFDYESDDGTCYGQVYIVKLL